MDARMACERPVDVDHSIRSSSGSGLTGSNVMGSLLGSREAIRCMREQPAQPTPGYHIFNLGFSKCEPYKSPFLTSCNNPYSLGNPRPQHWWSHSSNSAQARRCLCYIYMLLTLRCVRVQMGSVVLQVCMHAQGHQGGVDSADPVLVRGAQRSRSVLSSLHSKPCRNSRSRYTHVNSQD